MYNEDFKEFVKKGVVNKYHVGTGNPNAQILYIGKESAIVDDNYEGRKWYDKNATDWQNHIENNTCEILSYPIPKDHIFRREKSWGKNTWSKYQKLTDHIFEKEEKPHHIDFLKNVFTTEINDAPNKNTSTANKSKLNERKSLLKESDFIQNFPVVVLACSNYIKNNDDLREIDKIFGVKYEAEFPKKLYNKTNWFFSHYNEDRTKLVIHTRQLSADVKADLLSDIGEVIRGHLNKLSK
jgi:hypothetical protein